MNTYKIIFTGPVGAGKTTAIAAVSDIEPFQTEEIATDHTRHMKQNTTVAMDYGLMKLEGDERIHLYGTPGQERFDFMWDILTDGGLGLIILLNACNKDPQEDLKFYVNSFRSFIQETGVAVGVTRLEDCGCCSLEKYYEALNSLDIHAPVFSVDARNSNDIILLTQSLMYCIDPGMQ